MVRAGRAIKEMPRCDLSVPYETEIDPAFRIAEINRFFGELTAEIKIFYTESSDEFDTSSGRRLVDLLRVLLFVVIVLDVPEDPKPMLNAVSVIDWCLARPSVLPGSVDR